MDKKIRNNLAAIGDSAQMTRKHVMVLVDALKSQTYICRMCGNVIFPQVKWDDKNNVEIVTETNEFYGGKGNKKLVDFVCSDCLWKIEYEIDEKNKSKGLPLLYQNLGRFEE